MPRYSVSGIVLDADVDLPELVASPGAQARDWRLEATDGPRPPMDRALASYGDGFVRLGTSGDGFLLRFADLLDVVADPSDRVVRYLAAPGLQPHTLRHLLIDQVLPHLLALGGHLVLHASAVTVDGRAVVFAGRSGAGKSSLAASLAQQGSELIADDHVPLEPVADGYLAHPTYSGFRLWDDAAAVFSEDTEALPTVAEYTVKRRWALEAGVATGPRPLGAIVLVASTPAPGPALVELEPSTGSASFIELYQHAFRFERSGRETLTEDMDRFVALVQRVPVLRLRHVRDLGRVGEVAQELLERLRASVPELQAQ